MSPQILLIGAGRSVRGLLQYFACTNSIWKYHIRIGDLELDACAKLAVDFPNTSFFQTDVTRDHNIEREIINSQLVISMLPAHLHPIIAQYCLKNKKHLLTASYLDEWVKSKADEIREANIIFGFEFGLDPGIDHLGILKLINQVKNQGGEISHVSTYTGGLIEKTIQNPWDYKFTWNPRNVVLAGQGSTQYLENGITKYMPYSSLFKNAHKVKLGQLGYFDAYPNRNSSEYISYYGIQECKNFIRGTLRHEGFCEAWDFFVQLGLTDDSYFLNCLSLTFKKFISSFLPKNYKCLEDYLQSFSSDFQNSFNKKLIYLDFYSDLTFPFEKASPAQLLLYILEQKWKMSDDDRDWVLMYHELKYKKNNQYFLTESFLSIKGETNSETAMSKGVGVPMGIMANWIMEDKLDAKGIITPFIGIDILKFVQEIENQGFKFQNTTRKLNS